MKLVTSMAISAVIFSMALATAAQAQTPAEKAVIDQAKAESNGRDLSVKIKTKKQSNTIDMKDAVTTTTSEVSMPKPMAEQGAPNLAVVDESQYVPVVDEESSLVYLTGGVGESEIAYFKALKTGYSLKMLIADKDGSFLTDANVTISNAAGQKVATLSNVGPFLLVKLPAGKYTLTTSAYTVQVGQVVTIHEGKLTAIDVRL